MRFIGLAGRPPIPFKSMATNHQWKKINEVIKKVKELTKDWGISVTQVAGRMIQVLNEYESRKT